MFNILFGVSITLNVVLVIAIFIYSKIKAFGIKKVQKDFFNDFFCTDDELDTMLEKL